MPDMTAALGQLSVFQEDWARLTALGIVAVVVVVLKCVRPISEAWVADRKDRRRHDLETAKLVGKLDSALSRTVGPAAKPKPKPKPTRTPELAVNREREQKVPHDS